MPDIWLDVDAAVTVPVNLLPLLDDTDFKTREAAVAYNAAGLELIWNFITTAGAQTQYAVTPTETGGNYDWINIGHGMYNIEIPASGGASINNDTEGFGWFTGKATGVLPWRGPVIGFRAAGLNNKLIDRCLQYHPGPGRHRLARRSCRRSRRTYPSPTPEGWTWTARSRQILTPSWKIPAQPWTI